LAYDTKRTRGPYSEVYAALLVGEGFGVVTRIPFIAMESLERLRGGRASWALPKILNTFEGAVGFRRR
jgi:hypothetical protein